MTLALGEFVRRFARHVLPERLVKIRHYGLLANRGRQARVAQVQAALGRTSTATALEPEPPLPPATGDGDGESVRVCPHRGAPALVLLARVPRPCVHRIPVIDSS